MASPHDIPITLAEALAAARMFLSSRHELVRNGLVDTEAEQIVQAAVLQRSGRRVNRLDLYAGGGDPLPPGAGEEVLRMARGRAMGRPLQHLTGWQAFLEHEYQVGPAVLVPRPETEMLVLAAFDRFGESEARLGFELGLGSGILSIELLSRLPKLRMRASELSAGARELALSNASRILGPGAERLSVLPAPDARAAWEVLGEGPADFLISNPPYLEASDEIDEDVRRHEPPEALFAPAGDPLHFYRLTAEQGPKILKTEGWAFLEVPVERARAILGLFKAPDWEAELLLDLAGRDRVLAAQLKKAARGKK